jgi:DNA polymerase III subunit epsilon
MDFVAIDFETANAKRISACSIGMAKVRNGEITETFHELIKPEPFDFNYINISIHGITPEMVASKPTFIELWSKINSFIGNDVLVAHNVSFEQSVINQILNQNSLQIPNFDYLCTLYMTRVNYPRRLGYKLDDVCKDLLGKNVNHHDALEDAIACAELAIHNISKFPKQPLRELMGALYVTPQREKTEWIKLTGIKPSREELDQNHPYFDKRFVVTGVLHSFSREKAVQLIVDCGGIYQDSVTRVTDYLIVGDEEYQLLMFGNKSSKARKVDELNSKGGKIEVVKEDEFLKTVIQ